MNELISGIDLSHMRRAVQLALKAESAGNLPIGCVITYEGESVAEGMNAIWTPEFDPTRHAEMEALSQVPKDLWSNSREVAVYSTLEPCLMCLGAILQYSVGRVVFGSSDDYGGAARALGHLPRYFEDEFNAIRWIGPALPEACDPLYERAMRSIRARQDKAG